MKQVKLGIIGCGGFVAGLHMNNILAGKCPSIAIAAVSNRTVSKAHDVAKMLADKGITVSVYETDLELIEKADVDAVLINTPHYQHEELCLAAFARGLHVLCEKPSGAYTLQGYRINEAAKDTDKLFGMVFHHRTDPANIKIREIVQSGMLGEIRRINWISTDSYRGHHHYDQPGWRGQWETDGGGVVMNQLPHRLDLVRWIFGMPKKVTGHLGFGKWHDNMEVDDDVTAFFEYENGATAVIIGSTSDIPGTNRLEITAEYGKLVCENRKITFYRIEEGVSVYSRKDPTGKTVPPVFVEDIPVEGEYTGHAGVVEAFGRAILEGTEQIADGRDGVLSLTLANALILSQWNDSQAVTLPLDDEEYFKRLQEHYKSNQ